MTGMASAIRGQFAAPSDYIRLSMAQVQIMLSFSKTGRKPSDAEKALNYTNKKCHSEEHEPPSVAS